MGEENFREEEMRIQEVRTARRDMLRDVIREARMEVPKLLLEIERKYLKVIEDRFQVDWKLFKEKKERARRR